ncbi:MAG TPA: HD domain-containing phosphohydrolase [Candidatus Omnitrophota bacterium]|nr:HD domain-containing phosphohydrolase [Candidatus Omnitrophota bacterium]
MDIEILVKKTTFISIGAIIPVALLYIALSYIQPILSPKLGPAWLTVPVLLSALIAFALFRFIKFILRMNESDLSKKFAYRPMLEKEAERTARARDVREMATFIVRDVSSFTRLDHTAVFILNDQKNAYALMSCVYRKKDRPKLELGLLLSIHSPLVAYLKDEKKPAVYGQIMHDLQNKDLTTHERKFLESVESEMAILGVEICVPSFCEDEMVGIMNLGNKITNEIYTAQDLQAFQTLANQTGRAIAGLLLKNEKIRLIVSSQKSLLETLEARDHYTRGHTERVSQYSMLLGNKLERLIHSIPNSISALHWTAQLHDLGKVGISDNILLKPAALNDEEFAKIKEHPTRGIEILGPLKEWFGEDIIQGVVHHHENYDGSGYPDKQKGDAIHIFARIIRVADAFDAMTTDRPYRKGLSIEEAMNEIKKFRKIQFDPVVADAFIELYNDGVLKKVMDELKKKFG